MPTCRYSVSVFINYCIIILLWDWFTERDYRLFCIAIAQRFVPRAKGEEEGEDVFRFFFTKSSPQLTFRAFTNLVEEEKERIRLEILAIQDRSLVVFKSMPSKLMLVTRYITVFNETVIYKVFFSVRMLHVLFIKLL